MKDGVQKTVGAYIRYRAIIIDSVIPGLTSYMLNFAYFYLFSFLNFKIYGVVNEDTMFKLFYVFSFTVYFIYEVYFIVNKGATWGKSMSGLKIVSYGTTNLINSKTAIIRTLLKSMNFIFVISPIISIIFLFINGLIIIFSKEKRTIHDRIAGTQVIKAEEVKSTRNVLAFIIPLIIASIIAIIFTLYYTNTTYYTSKVLGH